MQNAYAEQKRLQKGNDISLLVPAGVTAIVTCMVIVAVAAVANASKGNIKWLLAAAAAAAAAAVLITFVDFADVVHTFLALSHGFGVHVHLVQ